MEEMNSSEATDLLTKPETPESTAIEVPEQKNEKRSDCIETKSSEKSPEVESDDTESSVENQEGLKKEVRDITFKLVFNKEKLDIIWNANDSVLSLKKHIQNIVGVPPAMQKLMFKGLMKDDQILADIGVTNGSKMMLVGSKLNDVISVNSKSTEQVSTSKDISSTKRPPLSKQKPHLKITEQGIPEEAMPAYRNGHEPLPQYPLYNMMNKYGHRVRLTFKLETDQLWIGTKERTQKVVMSSIKDVISEPISGHEEYHMLALQLGPTEQSRYWIYWVPAQYVNAIKDMILGKFF